MLCIIHTLYVVNSVQSATLQTRWLQKSHFTQVSCLSNFSCILSIFIFVRDMDEDVLDSSAGACNVCAGCHWELLPLYLELVLHWVCPPTLHLMTTVKAIHETSQYWSEHIAEDLFLRLWAYHTLRMKEEPYEVCEKEMSLRGLWIMLYDRCRKWLNWRSQIYVSLISSKCGSRMWMEKWNIKNNSVQWSD